MVMPCGLWSCHSWEKIYKLHWKNEFYECWLSKSLIILRNHCLMNQINSYQIDHCLFIESIFKQSINYPCLWKIFSELTKKYKIITRDQTNNYTSHELKKTIKKFSTCYEGINICNSLRGELKQLQCKSTFFKSAKNYILTNSPHID